MKHILCVRLKNFPIDRFRRRLRALRHKPLVLIETIAGRQIIAAVSDEAAAKRIWAGMTLVEAHALCPGLVHAEHNPIQDARGLEALGRYMQRFTPVVALPNGFFCESASGVRPALPLSLPSPSRGEGRGEGDSQAPCTPADHLMLDLTGCDRLFGGMDNLVHQITGALSQMQLECNLALAPTPGAAWALAAYGTSFQIANCKSKIENDLASLPPAALRIGGETAAALHHLGIETIGQLMALPRAVLPSRFGPELLLRLDQALGKIAEPLVPLGHQAPIEAGMQFEAAIESLETIWLAFRQLLQEVVTELRRRGCGARKLGVRFLRDHAPPLEKTIELSRPSRSLVNLFNLLRCALETLEADEGFIGLHLSVPAFERLCEEQATLLAQEDLLNREELDHLIERLAARLGHESLDQPALAESHIPELAYVGHGRPTRGSLIRTRKSRASRPCHEKPVSTRPGSRPLHLLPEPAEVGVMVAPSDDRDGRPVQVTLGRAVHPVRIAIGPERIAGEWWRGHNKTRDYYEIENPAGQRFWIFRVRETGKWYLHGIRE